jgi:hypothetical protein
MQHPREAVRLPWVLLVLGRYGWLTPYLLDGVLLRLIGPDGHDPA